MGRQILGFPKGRNLCCQKKGDQSRHRGRAIRSSTGDILCTDRPLGRRPGPGGLNKWRGAREACGGTSSPIRWGRNTACASVGVVMGLLAGFARQIGACGAPGARQPALSQVSMPTRGPRGRRGGELANGISCSGPHLRAVMSARARSSSRPMNERSIDEYSSLSVPAANPRRQRAACNRRQRARASRARART